MGASEFFATGYGDDADEAFDYAVSDAKYQYGHGGYTGTIAEKNDFRMIQVPDGKDPYDYADELLDDDNHWVGNKWGPAGCIEIRAGIEYYFFGWASS